MRTLAAVTILLFGCSGGSDNPRQDAATGDATQADAPQHDATIDASPGNPEGMVMVSEDVDSDGNESGDATVSIYAGTMFGPPTAQVGGCKIYNDPSETTLSAGVVTVTGTTTALTLTPDGSTPPVEYTSNPEPPDNLFNPGATISISAAGAVVPAFSGSVTAPAKLAGVTLPQTISRSTDTNVTWNAGSAGGAWVWVFGADSAFNAFGLIWCRTTDSGSYAIPAAAVAMFPSQFTFGFTLLVRANESPVTAGAWTINLTAADVAMGDFGAIVP
jgi:hypothetical protein